MLFSRRLHCPRNIVHMNLFLSLILRAFISLLRELLFVNGVGFQKDVMKDDYGSLIFIEEGPVSLALDWCRNRIGNAMRVTMSPRALLCGYE